MRKPENPKRRFRSICVGIAVRDVVSNTVVADVYSRSGTEVSSVEFIFLRVYKPIVGSRTTANVLAERHKDPLAPRLPRGRDYRSGFEIRVHYEFAR